MTLRRLRRASGQTLTLGRRIAGTAGLAVAIVVLAVAIGVNVVRVAMGLWSRLAGEDTTARPGLPVHELLAPLPVIAIATPIRRGCVAAPTFSIASRPARRRPRSS